MPEALVSLSAGASNIENDPPPKAGYSDLDVTYSDFDLFSEDADTPYLDYFEDTSSLEDLDFDAVDQENDETFSDTLFRNDVTIASPLPLDNTDRLKAADDADTALDESAPGGQPIADVNVDVQPVGAIEFGYDAEKKITPRGRETEGEPPPKPVDTQSRLGPSPVAADVDTSSLSPSAGSDADPFPTLTTESTRARGWKTPVLMGLLLALLLSGLYMYRERDSLSNNPLTRPLMVAACSVIGCEVAAISDIDQLKVLRRYVFSHPKTENALVVNVVFRNEADFEQRYPVLVINMSDITGKVVASRNFQPDEYLPVESRGEKQVLAAQTSIEVSLEIKDPGKNANSFTIDFR